MSWVKASKLKRSQDKGVVDSRWVSIKKWVCRIAELHLLEMLPNQVVLYCHWLLWSRAPSPLLLGTPAASLESCNHASVLLVTSKLDYCIALHVR